MNMLGVLLMLLMAVTSGRQHEIGEREALCRIELSRIAEVGGDEVDRSLLSLVLPDRILIRRDFAPHELAVFQLGARGKTRFIRAVGRPGQGPGEFSLITAALPLPDGRWALFDPRNLRITHLSPSFEVLFTHPMPVAPAGNGVKPLPDGGFLATGQMVEREHYGSPLVQLDSLGGAVRYFGVDETEQQPGPLRGRMVPRVLAYHPVEGVVTMKTAVEYVIESWNRDGTLRRRILRTVPWFDWPGAAATTGRHLAGAAGPPEHNVAGIQFDEAGRLWILTSTSGEDWREGLDRGGRVVDQAKWRDYVLEVFDLRSERSLCTTRLTDLYVTGGFVGPGPGVLSSYREDAAGTPTITFWKLSLTGTK